MAETLSDRCRRLAAPLLERVAKALAAMGVTPNTLTALGIVPYFLMAWLLYEGHDISAALVLMIFAPLDVVDGTLARITGQESDFGAFLDSTIDRIEEIIMYGALLAHLLRFHTDVLFTALLVLAALTGSVMVSYTRARAEGLGYECDVGLLTRFERMVLFILALLTGWYEPILGIIAVFSYFTTFQRIMAVYEQTRNR
jgi:CDP-diacylglycerol--glycerol-3-phosphate 3-phosphatidyltransferase